MFHFRLQAVLDIRKNLEDKAISELSQHQKELQHELNNLHILKQRKEELIDSLRDIKDRPVSVSDIVLKSARIKRYQEEESVQLKKVQRLENMVEQKRHELIEATKKKKAMEICKARHFETYQYEEKKQESAMMDELVITEHSRRKQA